MKARWRSLQRNAGFSGQEDLFNEVEQLLDDETVEQAEITSTAKPNKKGGGRKKFSDKLQRVQTTIDLAEHEKLVAVLVS